MIRNDYRNKWITNDLLYALSTESKIITEDRLNAYISENDQVCRETIEALKENYLISQEGNDKGEYSINMGLISKRELSEDECAHFGNDLSENAIVFLVLLYKVQRHVSAYKKTNPPAIAELLEKDLVYVFDDYYCSSISLNSTEAIYKAFLAKGSVSENQIILKRFKTIISGWQKYGI